MINAETSFSEETGFIHIPPRSKLYPLLPLGMETHLVESLTSYINRLALAYRIKVRAFVHLEIIANTDMLHSMKSSYLNMDNFGRTDAMSINGTGMLAISFSETLNKLTSRSDLGHLTLKPWAEGVSTLGLLRAYPAWCPSCYFEWKKKEQPVYQPLLWMLQVVTICTTHLQKLEDRCPYCGKYQSTFAVRAQPDVCSYCESWLGMEFDALAKSEIDIETRKWQEWVVLSIEELHMNSIYRGTLSWEEFPNNLKACVEAIGSLKETAHLTNGSTASISRWLNNRGPSLERFLAFCFMLNITPFQLLGSSPPLFNEKNKTGLGSKQARPKKPVYPEINYEEARSLIYAVLDGREKFLGMRQIEKRLGLGSKTLQTHFPQECAILVAQGRANDVERRKQRVAQTQEAVRQAVLTLHMQGINPSYDRVRALLSKPYIMSRPEANDTWRAVRQELGWSDKTS